MAVTDLLDWVHHDGSGLYVDDPAPRIGQVITVRLRVPSDLVMESVHVRVVHDGEPRWSAAARVSDDGTEAWFEAQVLVRNRRTHYRWLLLLPGGRVAWHSAAGTFDHDVSDAGDFVVTAHPLPPAWARRAVAYQVFPDRFARSSREHAAPEWAVPRAWDERPSDSPVCSREWFGGDLWGVIDHLDHLEQLGVDTLYLTPIFPAGSTHRYDAATFDHVDPLLGGDEAFDALVTAVHARGMRLVLDITLNHCGRGHEWFQSALHGDPETRAFFTFDDSLPHGYECWWGVASLPKFDHRSPVLRERLITGVDSVMRRWLRRGADGWRVDVANMTGRQADVDITHEVARATHDAVRAEGEDRLLIAEHGHDFGQDIDGDGWHGSMNYSAFARPVLSWLVQDGFDGRLFTDPIGVRPATGGQVVASMRSFTSGMPWRSWLHSWPLLGSHDTARVRSVVGSRERQAAAALMLMTMPGTPMVFAGDEVGAEGMWGEDSRTPFPWDRPDERDEVIHATYRDLIGLRRTHQALAEGGMRWVHVSDDALVWLRETTTERLLVAVARTGATVHIDARRAGLGGLRCLIGEPTMTRHEDDLTVTFAHAGGAVWQVD